MRHIFRAKDVLADRSSYDSEDIRDAKDTLERAKLLEDDDICSATITLKWTEEEPEEQKKRGFFGRLTKRKK